MDRLFSEDSEQTPRVFESGFEVFHTSQRPTFRAARAHRREYPVAAFRQDSGHVFPQVARGAGQ